ncbi:MAG: Yop proteins translocation protein L [Chlamydiales bacterium]|nr:Yop proteins translocation protein L [Chlamydiales bacterium]MCH9619634.1 Yop proteins translocation protein L [Chlamydiales bacterium]MCH9623240.1 Yop proteins translocation protein L [Chlamydiales bacterium]
MKFFCIIDKSKEVHINGDTKVIPEEEFAQFLSASQLIEEIEKKEIESKEQLEKEAAQIKAQSEEKGSQEGLEKWNAQIAFLESELKKTREEIAHSIVPLALTAVKKIIGKELEQKPATILDIVTTALKPVSQHKKIALFVNKNDLERLEKNRNDLKKIFEHLESLAISARDDVAQGGCIIETEVGIINAQLDSQMNALEGAFRNFFENKGRK